LLETPLDSETFVSRLRVECGMRKRSGDAHSQALQAKQNRFGANDD